MNRSLPAAGLILCAVAIMAAPVFAPFAPYAQAQGAATDLSIPDLDGAAGARAEMFYTRLDNLYAEPDVSLPDLGTLPQSERVLALLEQGRATEDRRVRELFLRTARDQTARLSLSDAALFRGLDAGEADMLRNQIMPAAIQMEDRANTAWMRRQINEIGWFAIGEYGAAADDAASLLVQHADHEPQFQRQVLTMLETLWREGQTNPRNYAYLYDRVAMNTGALSRYGTQGDCNAETGLWTPFEMEGGLNAANASRAEMGLDPLPPAPETARQICAGSHGGPARLATPDP